MKMQKYRYQSVSLLHDLRPSIFLAKMVTQSYAILFLSFLIWFKGGKNVWLSGLFWPGYGAEFAEFGAENT